MRSMRRLIALFVIFQLLFLTVLAVRGSWLPPGPPNILLITVDRLRADHVSALVAGKAQTPRIDALAARGTLFEKAFAQTEFTTNSHQCIFASRYLSELVVPGGARVPVRTMAQVLQGMGYRTAAVPSASILHPRLTISGPITLSAGFDEFLGLDRLPDTPSQEVRRPGAETTARAVSWLKARGREPWFLFVNLRDCHRPINLPEGWMPPPGSTRQQVYANAVRYVDSLVGQILDTVRDSGLERNTRVVFMADHGGDGEEAEADAYTYVPSGASSTRGLEGLYNDMVWVPLIVSVPGRAPARVSEVVESIDVMPTVLGDLAGEKLQVSGHNRFQPGGPRLAYAQTVRLEGIMVTDGRWKYIEFAQELKRYDLYRAKGTRELYDLLNDPGEKNNLVKKKQDVVERMRYALARKFWDNQEWLGGPQVKKTGRFTPLDYF
ncbi:MAG: hypothetical protein FJX76_01780 [Armatimonadetes bacterium]|nr:hypothetical protein [Armatimonadota bacterium]